MLAFRGFSYGIVAVAAVGVAFVGSPRTASASNIDGCSQHVRAVTGRCAGTMLVLHPKAGKLSRSSAVVTATGVLPYFPRCVRTPCGGA
jgi:hypothetical protein